MTTSVRLRRARTVAGLSVLLLMAVGLMAFRWRSAAPAIATGIVSRGDYIDVLEIRGEIRPRKSIVVSAPMQAGDLQILKIAPNGSSVKAGDVVLQFDGSTLQRTIQERESELRQA